MKEKCVQWVHVTGQDPQTKQEHDFFDCAIKWIPALSIQNAKEVNHTTASVDQLRDDLEKAHHQQQAQTNTAFQTLINVISEQNTAIIGAIHALARASEQKVINVGPKSVSRVGHSSDHQSDEDGR